MRSARWFSDREELAFQNRSALRSMGLNPDDLASPWTAAAFSFCAFGAGAVVPLIPFLLHASNRLAQLSSVGLTLTALFGIGMALSLFNGRSALRGGLRMVLIGGAAATCTWALGHALGTTLS